MRILLFIALAFLGVSSAFAMQESNGKAKRQRVAWACSNCAIAKKKCNSESPCERCQQRNLTCVKAAGKLRNVDHDLSWSFSEHKQLDTDANSSKLFDRLGSDVCSSIFSGFDSSNECYAPSPHVITTTFAQSCAPLTNAESPPNFYGCTVDNVCDENNFHAPPMRAEDYHALFTTMLLPPQNLARLTSQEYAQYLILSCEVRQYLSLAGQSLDQIENLLHYAGQREEYEMAQMKAWLETIQPSPTPQPQMQIRPVYYHHVE